MNEKKKIFGKQFPFHFLYQITFISFSPFSFSFFIISDDDDKDDDGDASSKRLRTAFTSTQLLELEREFAANMYLSRFVSLLSMCVCVCV